MKTGRIPVQIIANITRSVRYRHHKKCLLCHALPIFVDVVVDDLKCLDLDLC